MQRADRGAVLDLLEHAFGIRELFERYMDFDPEFAYGDFLLALDGDAPVACVQVFAKTIRLRGRAVRLGGIGSVATHASQRGGGLASDLLERALERMRARGMAISLLFAAPVAPLYERLGWRKIPAPLLRLSRARPDAAPAAAVRPFTAADLERVSALYDAFVAPLSGPTVRDARYWRGQLRTAGTPSERFLLCERASALDAYLRCASFNGRLRALEYARAPGGAESLAALLAGAASGERALYVPFVRDAELADALERRGIAIGLAADPSPMWRVLDRGSLAEIAALPGSTSDAQLLDALIVRPPATYWTSDRF
ncbi:MAG TPA: GNAT family N-acetyltransferase [Myxococcota bacterium]|nr:GNAT family N-acetyltransferase [Myxococcota bacterium]